MAKDTNIEAVQEVKKEATNAKCIKEFYDKVNNQYVKVGEELKVSEDRLKTLIAYGVVVKK